MLSIACQSPAAFVAPPAMAFTRTRGITMQEDDLQERLNKAVPVFSIPEDSAPPVVDPPFSPSAYLATLPGASAPFGVWDPAGFCSDANGADGSATEGKVRFYREVELKHCRIAMLAAVGFPVAEQFHPLFNVDTPSFSAFQQTPLQTFWPVVVGVIAVFEVFSVFTFENPNVEVRLPPFELGTFARAPAVLLVMLAIAAAHPSRARPLTPQGWAISKEHTLGELGNRAFDPLGLKPTDAEGLKTMQTKELNNGRLAMIAIAGMIVQEGITGQKLF
jgi:hypothetical protein